MFHQNPHTIEQILLFSLFFNKTHLETTNKQSINFFKLIFLNYHSRYVIQGNSCYG